VEADRARLGPWIIFFLVFAMELAFGMLMNSRGVFPNDAASRASLALNALYGSDPHLAAIGFSWMPLPTMLELSTAALYPFWTAVVSSGFAFTAITAVAAGASGALLLVTCSRLKLPAWIGWCYALVVLANPMLFLYGANGLSEGVGAPFFIGSVCFLTLYWHSGQRLYVGASGLCLAFAFACVYEATFFGAALLVALAGGLLWSSESRGSNFQGRCRAIQGLGLTLIVPSVFLGALWLVTNAVVMGDPLYFTHGTYSSFSQNRADAAVSVWNGAAYHFAGDVLGSLRFTLERTWAFMLPMVFLLLVRALDRRLFRINSLSLIVVALSVPFGLITPLVYRGLSIGYLRYLMYPLFAAAGWGLYEIAISNHRRRAVCLVLVGWIAAGGATLWTMSVRAYGPETESVVVKSVLTSKDGEQLGFANTISLARPIARVLEDGPMRDGGRVVADQLRAFAIAANLSPRYLHRLILTPDRRFHQIVADPRRFGVRYFLVPSPEAFPTDQILRARPRLWSGDEPGFKLVTDFPSIDTPEHWRLYEVTEPDTAAR